MDINQTAPLYDALIVEGGPAGLSAGIYLGRFCRTVAVVDCRRTGRSDYAQINRNFLGFPDGLSAVEMGERGREQAERFGVRFYEAEVVRLSRGDGVFVAQAAGGLELHARAVVLATGVEDRWVEFPGYEEFVGRTLHWCIVCDGYEMRDQRVVVVGNDDETADTAIQLLRFTDRVTLLTNAGSLGLGDETVERLDAHGIRLVVGRIAGARARPKEKGCFAALRLDGGDQIDLDHLFSHQGADPNTELARALGVELTSAGYVKVDLEARTSVAGVYAAGDVTRLFSHQIVTAAHEGAAAAMALSHDLFERDQQAFRVGRGATGTGQVPHREPAP